MLLKAYKTTILELFMKLNSSQRVNSRCELLVDISFTFSQLLSVLSIQSL